ncbi:hypothetical protein FACS1894176_00830 [Bacteroidia bacterium]|nr:hypothetical protein FACS1894176_00830 [Bacteroidia bacterium]
MAGWIYTDDRETKLSTEIAKECIVDFYKQRYFVFNQLIRQYQIRYLDYRETHAGISGRTRLDRDNEGRQIQELLVKFILSQKEYKRTILNRPHFSLSVLNEYIDRFVIEHFDQLLHLQKTDELLLNKTLLKYESAMGHTLGLESLATEDTYLFGTDLDEGENEKYQASN